ncbi:hypothetical protein AV903_09915 [Erwinia tracheiphila]|uniref:D-lactate dehydrogenase n=1 Tax=Erwinia tracheiphila TaxID=65700 RepID=A0A345CS73_9GAMM|nr:hypothetical protein AV903_09915 [Erwinia tracheiphila]
MINSSSPTSQHLVTELTRIVGRNHLLTDPQPTERYRKGFRQAQVMRWPWSYPAHCWSNGAYCRPAWQQRLSS